MEKNNTHLSGEYFVAAELYRRGYSIGMTIGNAKAIDLFAYNGKETLSIQVKAIRNKKSGGWPLMTDKVIKNIMYVFVNLNDESNPEYFIASPKEAKESISQYSNRGTININQFKSNKFIDRWDKLKIVKKKIKKQK